MLSISPLCLPTYCLPPQDDGESGSAYDDERGGGGGDRGRGSDRKPAKGGRRGRADAHPKAGGVENPYGADGRGRSHAHASSKGRRGRPGQAGAEQREEGRRALTVNRIKEAVRILTQVWFRNFNTLLSGI